MFKAVLVLGIAVSLSACGLVSGTSSVKRGYSQARQGSSALMPLIAVPGKTVDGDAETYLLIRENSGRGAEVSVLNHGLGIRPTAHNTIGDSGESTSEENYAPFIDILSLESHGSDRPLLWVTLRATEISAGVKL